MKVIEFAIETLVMTVECVIAVSLAMAFVYFAFDPPRAGAKAPVAEIDTAVRMECTGENNTVCFEYTDNVLTGIKIAVNR